MPPVVDRCSLASDSPSNLRRAVEGLQTLDPDDRPKFLGMTAEEIVAKLMADGTPEALARELAQLHRFDGSRRRWEGDSALRSAFGTFDAFARHSRSLRSGQPPLAANP